MGPNVSTNQLPGFSTLATISQEMYFVQWGLKPESPLRAVGVLDLSGAAASLTCHSGSCPGSCSALTHAVHPTGSSPCLHCGWRMRKARAPGPHSFHCHYHCHCFCSLVAPPRNLWGKSDNKWTAAELQSFMCTQMWIWQSQIKILQPTPTSWMHKYSEGNKQEATKSKICFIPEVIHTANQFRRNRKSKTIKSIFQPIFSLVKVQFIHSQHLTEHFEVA